jgi:hypothetical protein
MPATLQSIRGKTVELFVYLGDPDVPEDDRSREDGFTLTYRQHNFTGNMEKLAKEAEKDGNIFESLCEICVPLFKSWDLKPGATEEQVERLEAAESAGDKAEAKAIRAEIVETVAEQEPIPITKDGLMEYVPVSVLVLIMTAIGESRNPNPSGTGKR